MPSEGATPGGADGSRGMGKVADEVGPAELEMLDVGQRAIVYGVIGYPGRATVDLATGSVGSFTAGQPLPSP